MKKIIALLALFFAFSVNVSAQDNSVQIEKNAKSDLEKLMTVITVENDMQMTFFNLFKKKHEGMLDSNATEASRREISRVIEAKLRATLTPQQTASLEKNKTVLAQLVGAPAPVASAKK
ncbi:hypothetical protein FCR2A7T_16870 [Flavobacterium cauense R2A-7]|uniref:LTXXQ motif family protein n=1 Tax=Flavobacterium cauense R2A-7 TaxID=1341154 RepID=V6RZS9_9FLAO|nr:hypothetical protein [Flavobacterium cauense]ESU19532.1 hypothetical protein FCR2A7T_16870 [Flavobacterium cauense R2A-7]KGO84062.1 hypothetical protein Q762_02150 [Flavobacterium cauense R2A-7]TWI14594.1 hypothetical protein IP98_00557 [Flavobacterium cauense R2A-7]